MAEGSPEREGRGPPTEAEVAASADAAAGLALVEARVALCTPEEQAAFWAAVGRCFGGGKPPDAGPAAPIDPGRPGPER